MNPANRFAMPRMPSFMFDHHDDDNFFASGRRPTTHFNQRPSAQDGFSLGGRVSSVAGKIVGGLAIAAAVPVYVVTKILLIPLTIIGTLIGFAIGLPLSPLLALTAEPGQMLQRMRDVMVGSMQVGRFVCQLPVVPLEVLTLGLVCTAAAVM